MHLETKEGEFQINAISQLDLTNAKPVQHKSNRITFLKEAEIYFRKNESKLFNTVFGIELLTVTDFNKLRTEKSMIFTALEVVANRIGHVTRGTMGSLTEAVGLDQQDAHRIGCACLGQAVSGAVIAERIRNRIRALQS